MPVCELAQNDRSIGVRPRIPGHCEPVTDVTGVAIPKIDALGNNALQIAPGKSGGFSHQRALLLRMTVLLGGFVTE